MQQDVKDLEVDHKLEREEEGDRTTILYAVSRCLRVWLIVDIFPLDCLKHSLFVVVCDLYCDVYGLFSPTTDLCTLLDT